MSKTVKYIWIAYAIFTLCFAGYTYVSDDGDVFAWLLRLMIPHLGFFLWYAFKGNPGS